MSYLLTQALALLEEATSYTSCETWSPSLTDEINSFVVNARAALAATPAPAPEGEPTTGQLLMGLAVIREITGTQQQDLEATIEAVRKALAATPAPAPAQAQQTAEYQGVRCMCVLTGCKAGPGSSRSTKVLKA